MTRIPAYRAVDSQPAAGSPKGLPPVDSRAGLDSLVGRDVFDGTFPLPTMILRDSALRHNLATMADYCAVHGLLLAPHAKTTMSPELVSRQLVGGAWGMTVATAWQAAQVAAMGVDRLILANEVVDRGSLRLLQQTLLDHPQLTVWTYIDSAAGLRLLSEEVRVPPGRLRLLVELGVPRGRAGVRTADEALALARAAADGPHPLVGVGAFEGIIGGSEPAIEDVDAFLRLLAQVARALEEAGLLADDPLVTAGGSAYPDRVAEVLRSELPGRAFRIVLRSGCSLTHDCGSYRDLSPFGPSQRVAGSMISAIEVWAPVLSRPEPDRVIVGLGKRDVSYDAGLPVVLTVRAQGQPAHEIQCAHDRTVIALNDQHAYLTVDASDPIAVSDLVCVGISHPCTTFDKWRSIPIVDDEYRVIEIATTHF